jgi:hypothetical protein
MLASPPSRSTVTACPTRPTRPRRSLKQETKTPNIAGRGTIGPQGTTADGREGACAVVRSSTEPPGGRMDGHYAALVVGVNARGDRWRDGYFGGWMGSGGR